MRYSKTAHFVIGRSRVQLSPSAPLSLLFPSHFALQSIRFPPDVAQIGFFAESVYRVHLRLAHGFYADVHRQTYVAVSENGLNRFIIHGQSMNVCRQAGPELEPNYTLRV